MPRPSLPAHPAPERSASASPFATVERLPWHETLPAARLIADLAANPPRHRYVTGIVGPNDGAVICDDPRFRKLEAIYMVEQSRVEAECREAKDFAPFYAMVRPEDAVAAARSTLRSRKAA